MAKRVESIQQQLANLRESRMTFRGNMDAIGKHVDYSDSYKRQQQATLAATYAGQARTAAEAAWKSLQAARSATRKDLATKPAWQDSRDYARLAFLHTSMGARIGQRSTQFGGGGNRQLDRIAEIEREAREAGDSSTLSALRDVASPILEANRGTEGGDSLRASEMLQRCKTDAVTDVPQEVRTLREELREIDRVEPALREEILATERTIDPRSQQAGAFAMPSPWPREILGDSLAARGGGGVWPGSERQDVNERGGGVFVPGATSAIGGNQTVAGPGAEPVVKYDDSGLDAIAAGIKELKRDLAEQQGDGSSDNAA